MGNSNLGLKHAHLLQGDVSALEVVVVLKRNIARGEVIVGGTVCLFEARELFSHLHLTLDHSSEVPPGEDAVVRDRVVHRVRLVFVQVLEVAGIRVTEVERQEGVSVVDTVKLLTIHELLNVLLDNWCLVDGCSLCSGSVGTDAVSECEDVLIAFVLECVWVDIDDALAVGDARSD